MQDGELQVQHGVCDRIPEEDGEDHDDFGYGGMGLDGDGQGSLVRDMVAEQEVQRLRVRKDGPPLDGAPGEVGRAEDPKRKVKHLDELNANKFKNGVPRSLLKLGEGELHHSHRMHHCRGIVWCWRCGCYASETARGLHKVCEGQPTRGQHYFLKRLAERKTPRKSMSWPLADGEGPPEGPVLGW